MQQKPNEQPKNIGLFLLNSQPPNIGELISVLSVIDKYDGLILCFKTPIQIMPIKHVTEIWTVILEKYKGKFILTSCNTDFATVSKLTKDFKDKTILTLSKRVFVHLSTMGMKVKLVDRVKGYHSMFLRSAYIQGRALDYINENYGTKR
jgi:hypothetical protein